MDWTSAPATQDGVTHREFTVAVGGRMVPVALCTLPEVDADAIGWYGVSMGTAYGLPLVASEPRIRAAALGMWGLSYPNSGRLAEDAPRVRCPALFQQKWGDEIFSRESQIDLFDKLGSQDKRMTVYMGGHRNPEGEQLDEIFTFLLSRLHCAR